MAISDEGINFNYTFKAGGESINWRRLRAYIVYTCYKSFIQHALLKFQ